MYNKLKEARDYTEIAQAEADDAKFRADELLKAETAVDSMGRPFQGDLKDYGYEDRAKAQSEKVRGYFSSKDTEARYNAMNAKNSIVTGATLQRKFRANLIKANRDALITEASLVDTSKVASVFKKGIAMGSIDKIDADNEMAQILVAKDPELFLVEQKAGKFPYLGEKAGLYKKQAVQNLMLGKLYAPDGNLKEWRQTYIIENAGGLTPLEMEKVSDLYRGEKGEIQLANLAKLRNKQIRRQLTSKELKLELEKENIDENGYKSLESSLRATPSLTSKQAAKRSIIDQMAAVHKKYGGVLGIWGKDKEAEFNEYSRIWNATINAKNGGDLTEKDADRLLRDVENRLKGFDKYADSVLALKDFTSVYSPTERGRIEDEMQAQLLFKIDSGMKGTAALDEVIAEQLKKEGIEAAELVKPKASVKTYPKKNLEKVAKDNKWTYDAVVAYYAGKLNISIDEMKKRIK